MLCHTWFVILIFYYKTNCILKHKITQINSCITSAIPLAAEFFLDFYSQVRLLLFKIIFLLAQQKKKSINTPQEIFSAAQLRERFLILVTMIAFSTTFIVCRKLDSIAEVYVAAHNIRFSILMTVIYYAGKIFTFMT